MMWQSDNVWMIRVLKQCRTVVLIYHLEMYIYFHDGMKNLHFFLSFVSRKNAYLVHGCHTISLNVFLSHKLLQNNIYYVYDCKSKWKDYFIDSIMEILVYLEQVSLSILYWTCGIISTWTFILFILVNILSLFGYVETRIAIMPEIMVI